MPDIANIASSKPDALMPGLAPTDKVIQPQSGILSGCLNLNPESFPLKLQSAYQSLMAACDQIVIKEDPEISDYASNNDAIPASTPEVMDQTNGVQSSNESNGKSGIDSMEDSSDKAQKSSLIQASAVFIPIISLEPSCIFEATTNGSPASVENPKAVNTSGDTKGVTTIIADKTGDIPHSVINEFPSPVENPKAKNASGDTKGVPTTIADKTGDIPHSVIKEYSGADETAEPIKIPQAAEIPSMPVMKDGMEVSKAAGPRERLPMNQKDSTGLKPNRSPEEAVRSETNREVSQDRPRPIDWFNDVFRKSVNDLARDGFRFPDEKPGSAQPLNQSTGDDPISKQTARSHPGPDSTGPPKPESKQVQNPIVEIRSEFQKQEGEAQVDLSKLGRSLTAIRIETSQPPKPESKDNQSGKQAPVKSQSAKPTGNDQSMKVEPAKSESDSKGNQESTINSLATRSVVRENPAVKVSIKPDIDASNNEQVTWTSDSTGISTKGVKTIDVQQPMHVLDNTSTRIASEIKLAESKILPGNGEAILRVELRPPRMGTLIIELSRDQSGMDIKLIARTDMAREILNQRGDEIRQVLLDHGITLRKFEIAEPSNGQNYYNHGFGANPNGTPFGRGGNEAKNPWGETAAYESLKDETGQEVESPLGGAVRGQHELDLLA